MSQETSTHDAEQQREDVAVATDAPPDESPVVVADAADELPLSDASPTKPSPVQPTDDAPLQDADLPSDAQPPNDEGSDESTDAAVQKRLPANVLLDLKGLGEQGRTAVANKERVVEAARAAFHEQIDASAAEVITRHQRIFGASSSEEEEEVHWSFEEPDASERRARKRTGQQVFGADGTLQGAVPPAKRRRK